MKRLLAIFVVLLLVLGGLFWWIKSKDNLKYDNPHSDFIPLKNNIAVMGYNYSSSWDILDVSNLQHWPNHHEFLRFDLISAFSRTDTHECYLDSLTMFNIYEDYLIAKSTDTSYSKASFLIFDLVDKKRQQYPLKNYLKFESDCKREGIRNPSMATPKEWLDIWKRDGRLPWFPEHVVK